MKEQMKSTELGKVLAVIPARGGSKGIPKKNIKPFCGLPLIVHTLRLMALFYPTIISLVTTDSAEIIEMVIKRGGPEGFIQRPTELAQDNIPLWPVVQHALAAVDRDNEGKGRPIPDYVLLLDPTSPLRLPQDVTEALKKLEEVPYADGVVSVSKPDWNPVWHSVVMNGDFLADLSPDAQSITRRQDAPEIYRINGLIYLWRADFVRNAAQEGYHWREGRMLPLLVPEMRAFSLDTLEQWQVAEAIVKQYLVKLP